MMILEEVARAFTIRRLSESQTYQMRDQESKLKLPTECFHSSQIAKDFLTDKRVEIADQENQTMNALWLHFYAQVLYPQQQAEEKLHRKGCTMFACKHPWDDRCKTKWQEMWQWDDYVLKNYTAPLVSGRGIGAGIMAALLFLVSR